MKNEDSNNNTNNDKGGFVVYYVKPILTSVFSSLLPMNLQIVYCLGV